MNKPGFPRVTLLSSDLRLAITLLFAGLICWRTLVDGELPTWLITGSVIFVGLVAILFLLEVGLGRYQAWLSVRSFCAMDPVTRDERLERIWPRALRAELMRRVNSEGTMEIDGMVERFPSLATARRAASLGYWLCVCMLCVTLGLVLRFSSALPAVAAIVAWAVIALLLSVARSLRARSDRLRAVLEISPHGIASVSPRGSEGIPTLGRRIETDAPRLGRTMGDRLARVVDSHCPRRRQSRCGARPAKRVAPRWIRKRRRSRR